MERRRFLQTLGAAAAAAAASGAMLACQRTADERAATSASTGADPAKPPGTLPPGVPAASTDRPHWPRTTIPLSEVRDGGRTVVKLGTYPVELRRAGLVVTARSLLCTHMGCPVAWREADSRYVCPCHGGLYDADGRAIEGPPPRGLDPVPIRRVGDRLLLG